MDRGRFPALGLVASGGSIHRPRFVDRRLTLNAMQWQRGVWCEGKLELRDFGTQVRQYLFFLSQSVPQFDESFVGGTVENAADGIDQQERLPGSQRDPSQSIESCRERVNTTRLGAGLLSGWEDSSNPNRTGHP